MQLGNSFLGDYMNSDSFPWREGEGGVLVPLVIVYGQLKIILFNDIFGER